MKRKLFAFLLALTLALSLLPAAALAAETTANDADALAAAIRSAAAGDTVRLGADVTLTNTLTVNKDITLDLSGNTLTVGTSGDGIAVVNAALTLTNTGSTGKYVFNCSASGSDGIFVNNTDANTTSTLNINSDVEIHVNSSVNSAIHAFAPSGKAVVNMNAGHIVATGSGKQFHAIHADQNSTINVNGGEFDLSVDFDSYSENNDVVGVSIYGSGGKQENIAVNIKNGTFKVGGRNAFVQAVQVGMVNGYSNNCTVNISGGNIILNPMENGTGYVYTTYKTSYATAEIKGGTISGNVTALVNAYISLEEITNDGLTVSGGTFNSNGSALTVAEKYLADGHGVVQDPGSGSCTVVPKTVEVWTGYSGTMVASYATIEDAVTNLGVNKWIVIGKNYTLTENFTIPTGVFLDVAADATLTVAENVTLTVAAGAKRLGVRTGATLVNNGTIMVCGTDYSNGKVMVQDNAVFDVNTLSVPEGYFLDNNGSNYFATPNADACFEITYSDGTVKKVKNLTNLTGATKVTMLKDVADFVRTFDLQDKLGDNFVLDLGGFTLSGKAAASKQVLSISVPMTITNGTIEYTSSNTGCGALTTSADVTIAADATINGGAGYAIWTDGYGHTLTVNGTVNADGDYAITSNGAENGGLIADCDIIVNDGATISAPTGIAIYHPEKGTVTINGGTIGGHTGIELCAGKLIVNDGTITSTGGNMDATGSQNAILDGAAISIINRNYPGGVPTAEIRGGKITAEGSGALALKIYDYTNNAVAEWTDAGESINVSGGRFSSEVKSEYCAAGYEPIHYSDGSYGVTVKTTPVIPVISGGSSSVSVVRPDNGKVTVNPSAAKEGETVTITVTPDAGYELGSLTVSDSRGNQLPLSGSGSSFTFTMPAGGAVVKAEFVKRSVSFGDVSANDYFASAVAWAVEKGITDGVGGGMFGPYQPCTRGQIVTFLWRAAGSPEPKAMSSFADVSANEYYAKAVAWAVENGITTGTTATTFGPNDTCTRAQAVTFLCRAVGTQGAYSGAFSDVASDMYCAGSVAWAVANGVTDGVGGGKFAPDDFCTRGQIVTFLYRAYQGK